MLIMLYYNILPNHRNIDLHITVMKNIFENIHSRFIRAIDSQIQILIVYYFVGPLLIFASLRRLLESLGLHTSLMTIFSSRDYAIIGALKKKFFSMFIIFASLDF